MDRLTQPINIKGLRFKNRMVHVPTTMNMSDPTGHVTDKLIGAYESIAAGGTAATVVGATCVRWDGLINERMLGMYDDTYVIGYRDLVDAIRNNGSLAGIQLFYGGMIPGLGSTVPLAPAKGWIPNTVAWGPSSAVIIGNPQPAIVPTEVYDSLVEDYAHGARRAREAGFDFVGFHFCHGSLPHTNLSLLANVGRTDAYADRFLFCERIIRRTQELCGKEFPIMPRLCCDENLAGGYDIDYFVEHYAPRLRELGIAVLDCTFGSMIVAPSRNPRILSGEYIGPAFYTPQAVNLQNIAYLKQRLVATGCDMPIVGSANLGTPEHLRAMVADGHAEFAGVCRLSMDDPEYANKIVEGREEELRLSTRTGTSLLQGSIFAKGWAGSAQNASFGRDREYRIRRTAARRKVVIVGGGSGGMEYAITARQIGHEVVLFESATSLGGAMDWAGNYRKLPNMEMLRYQPDYHRTMLARETIDVRLGVTATPDLVLEEAPDVVVIATGARSVVPVIEGLGAAMQAGFALTIDAAMVRSQHFDPGPRPVIVGSAIGGELAVDYAMQGLPVRLFEAAPGYVPANYLGTRARSVQALMKQYDLKVEGNWSLTSVGSGSAQFLRSDGERATVACSSLILALGREPNSEIAGALTARKVKVQVIGDARKPRSFGNAIHEAAYLARQI